MVLVVATVGLSGSGKTTTIEYLIGRFSDEGYRVGAVKHIHHQGFSMDREGTNTWRYADAGAKIVVAVSPNEVDVIRKTERELHDLDRIFALTREEKLDILFIEGFHSLISKRTDIAKIVTAKNLEELKSTLQGTAAPILAATGPVARGSDAAGFDAVEFVRIPEEGEKLVEQIRGMLPKLEN